MRQFDVLRNPNNATNGYSPYVVVLQSHHFAPLDTVFLGPLVRDAQRVLNALDIPVDVNGERLVLVIAEAAGVPRQGYGRAVGSLVEHEDAIRRAFERLLTGF